MNQHVLSVYLRNDDEKLFEALMSKYHCNEDTLVSVMIGVFSSIAYAPDEINLILGNGGDK